MPTWGSAAGVQKRIPYRAISSTSTPSQTTVETWLDEAEAELSQVLIAIGGSTSLSGDALELFRGWVEDRVAGQVLEAYATAGGDHDNESGTEHGRRWERRLAELRRHTGAFKSSAATAFLRSHVTDHPDGKTVGAGDFAPEFERGEKW